MTLKALLELRRQQLLNKEHLDESKEYEHFDIYEDEEYGNYSWKEEK